MAPTLELRSLMMNYLFRMLQVLINLQHPKIAI